MSRRFLVGVLFCLILLAFSQQSQALVMLRRLNPGDIPGICPKSIRPVLKSVKMIEGREIDGFGWTQVTMYCRGTHDELQALLDGLGQSEEIHVVLTIDRSGKPGMIKPTKAFPGSTTRWYLYEIHMSKEHRFANQFEGIPKTVVRIQIFSSGGIRPDQLIQPDNALTVEQLGKVLEEERKSQQPLQNLVVPAEDDKDDSRKGKLPDIELPDQ